MFWPCTLFVLCVFLCNLVFSQKKRFSACISGNMTHCTMYVEKLQLHNYVANRYTVLSNHKMYLWAWYELIIMEAWLGHDIFQSAFPRISTAFPHDSIAFPSNSSITIPLHSIIIALQYIAIMFSVLFQS